MGVKFVAVNEKFRSDVWGNKVMHEVNETAVQKLKIELIKMNIDENYGSVRMTEEEAKSIGALPEYKMNLVKPERADSRSMEKAMEPIRKIAENKRSTGTLFEESTKTASPTLARFGGEDGKQIAGIMNSATGAFYSANTAYKYFNNWMRNIDEGIEGKTIKAYNDIVEERSRIIREESRDVARLEEIVRFKETDFKKRGIDLKPNLNKEQIKSVIENLPEGFVNNAGFKNRVTELICNSSFFDDECKNMFRNKMKNSMRTVTLEIETLKESQEARRKYIDVEVDESGQARKQAERTLVALKRQDENIESRKVKEPKLEKKVEMERENGIVVVREKQVFVCPETKEEIEVKSIKQVEKGAVVNWKTKDGKESYWLALGALVVPGGDEEQKKILLTNESAITDQSGTTLKFVGGRSMDGEPMLAVEARQPNGEMQLFYDVSSKTEYAPSAFIPIGNKERQGLMSLGMSAEKVGGLSEPLKVMAIRADVVRIGSGTGGFAFADSTFTIANGGVTVANMPVQTEHITQCFQEMGESLSEFQQRVLEEFQAGIQQTVQETAVEAAEAAAEAAAEIAATTAETAGATALAVPTAGISYVVEASVEGVKIGMRILRGAYNAISEIEKFEQKLSQWNNYDLGNSHGMN